MRHTQAMLLEPTGNLLACVIMGECVNHLITIYSLRRALRHIVNEVWVN